MQTKRIKCPSCGVVLDVKNSKNEEVKQIICPQCRCILQIRFAPIISNSDGATQLAYDANGATQLATSTHKTITSAKLLFDGISYELEEGQNIIGRKGTTSKATVQIATEDRYMSRQHCAINITVLPDGTKKAVLSNYQNKNLTSVDGQEIETGDAIRLTDGNAITMGHTTVTFKMS